MKMLMLLAAVVILGFTSCKKQPEVKVGTKISNVLILGNSITFSAADSKVGWFGNWGMAASKPEFDYVHLLTAKFKDLNP